jgi:hypothetical protein
MRRHNEFEQGPKKRAMNSTFSTPPRQRGFTRIDLIATIAITTLLLGMALPVFGRNLTGARVIECLSTKKELIRAWAAFAGDHDGTVPGVLNGTATLTGTYFPEMPWARGWMSWDTSLDNTNTLRLSDPLQASLAPYLNGKVTPFKCPADVYQSSLQKLRAVTRLRSVSANTAVGPGNAEQGVWDSAYYRHITKMSQFTAPSPANTWIYIDEHPESINDPVFFPPTSATQWIDWPAGYHDGAAGFSMADGSAIMHRWLSPNTILPITYQGIISSPPLNSPDARADIAWVRDRTPHR